MSDAASAAAPCPVVRARSILQKVRAGGNEWFELPLLPVQTSKSLWNRNL